MKKSILIFVMSLCIIGLSGCEQNNAESKETSATTSAVTSQQTEATTTEEQTISETSEIISETEQTADVEIKPEAIDSFDSLRSYIKEKIPEYMGGMAFLGYVSEPFDNVWDALDPEGYYPFIADIPEANIIKHTAVDGEVWCFVPADENASVAVNSIAWDPESEDYAVLDILYKSEKGEPIVIICNGAGESPDVEINIVSGENSAKVYPLVGCINDQDCYDFTLISSSETAPVTEKELVIMARNYTFELFLHYPEYADVTDNNDGTYTIHLYDIVDDHTATYGWYTIDALTTMGSDDLSGEQIFFGDYEALG